MSRGILLVTGLVVFSAVLAQGQTTTPSTTAPPVNGPFGGPILVTPSVSFPNHVPTAGISDSGRAGISNAANGVETTTAPESPAAIVSTPSASLSESTSLSESANQTAVTDLGTSTFVRGASEESGQGTISLAEVSSRYKAEKGTRSARELSNEDVHTMLNNKSGVTMAKNMPPLGPGALEQSGQAQTGSQSATPSSQSTQQDAQTNASMSQQGQVASGQTGTQQPAPADKSQSAGTGVSVENSTTPQINQNQQANDTQGRGRLPATATFLPLLGLLGLASGGIGFWFRKFRN